MNERPLGQTSFSLQKEVELLKKRFFLKVFMNSDDLVETTSLELHSAVISIHRIEN